MYEFSAFGSFASREPDLHKVLMEAARIGAALLVVPLCRIWRYRAVEGDLLIEAGWGLHPGLIGQAACPVDETSPQGRAYVTGTPAIIRHQHTSSSLPLPTLCGSHSDVTSVDVVIPANEGAPYGVLEIDSSKHYRYDAHDIRFLTSFARKLAEAVTAATRIRAMRSLVDAKDLMAERFQHRVRNILQVIVSDLTPIVSSTRS